MSRTTLIQLFLPWDAWRMHPMASIGFKETASETNRFSIGFDRFPGRFLCDPPCPFLGCYAQKNTQRRAGCALRAACAWRALRGLQQRATCEWPRRRAGTLRSGGGASPGGKRGDAPSKPPFLLLKTLFFMLDLLALKGIYHYAFFFQGL